MSTIYSYGPNIYVDKMELFESLLADGHYNICNSDLLNDNWHFKIMGVVDGSWR